MIAIVRVWTTIHRDANEIGEVTLLSLHMDETVAFACISGQTSHISRKLLNHFKGSWFEEHFGQPGPITYPRWTILEKTQRVVYHVDVPPNVLEAFIQLHALPELFDIYSTQLPDCCTYGIKLDTWLRYLAQYFSNQLTLSLKRPREEEEEEEMEKGRWRRDFSRPPKRFRRDFKEWEMGKAFIQWIFDKHPEAASFLDAESESLQVVMAKDQTFPFGEKNIEILSQIFGKDKEIRIKKSIERIVMSHYDVSIKVDKFNDNVSASDLFSYPNHFSRNAVWPVKGTERLSIDDRFIVLTLTWEDWDGSSV